MITTILLATLLSFAFYIGLGFFYKREIKTLADMLPILKGTQKAKVKNDKEFSASTVAVSISLSTVILAFFQLVPGMGWWLLWAAITTALGFLLFSVLSKKIWEKLTYYKNTPPSIHAFIANEYSSKRTGVIASVLTAIGYLCMFSTELTVSSSFIAGLIPGMPFWLILVILSVVSFTYTSLGGMRVTVVSDRIQMLSIWALIFAMLLFFMVYIFNNGGISYISKTVPENVLNIKWANSLSPFLIGLLVMNLFTYITNMALWQRIAGTEKPEIFVKGMKKTVFQSAISWGLIVVLAVLAYTVASPPQSNNQGNFLINTMVGIYSKPFGPIIVFIVAVGLLGAMLSTASTQLIAVSHTIYEDIISQYRGKSISERVASQKELTFSRLILILSAVCAIGFVELLRTIGFNVADLAFSIYGAALSLAPPILFSLFVNNTILKRLNIWATSAILLGFIFAWGSAIYGIYILKEPFSNFVFFAPVFGLVVSFITLFVGYLINRKVPA